MKALLRYTSTLIICCMLAMPALKAQTQYLRADFAQSSAAYDHSQLQKNFQQDSVKVREHSPKKAALFSAIVPGLGQAYNRKYWKIPILYAGMGTVAYFIRENHLQYQEYRTAYIHRVDDDTNTVDLFPQFTDNGLRELKNEYWRRRDFQILLLTGIYIINILDAAVDAHLYTFDISDDLSLNVMPDVRINRTAFTGFEESYRLRFSFKF